MAKPKATAAKARATAKQADKAAKEMVKKQKKQETQETGLKRSNSTITATQLKQAKKHTRVVDAEVQRAFDKRVPGIGETVLHRHHIDGISLFDYMKKEKIKRAATGKYLTEDVWQQAFVLYHVTGAASKPCVVTNHKEVVDQGLVSAITIARSKNCAARNRTALVGWFRSASVKMCNQRTMAGIVSFLISLRPSANDTSALIMIEWMKLAERADLHIKYSKEVYKNLKNIFPSIFLKTF